MTQPKDCKQTDFSFQENRYIYNIFQVIFHMEHTYYTCDRCKKPFQHKDPMNDLYIVLPKPVEKPKEKNPFDKLFGENANLVMIPLPGMSAPVQEAPKWPENMKEVCPDCQIEFIRWWNNEFVATKLGVEPVEKV